MNKIGIYFAYWTDRWAGDFVHFAHKVAGLGFDVLEICPDSLLDKPDSLLQDIKRAADDEGIELTCCVGFQSSKDLASEDQSVREAGIDYARQSLRVTHRLGAKLIGGIIYSAWPVLLPPGKDKQPFLDRSIASVREIIKTAEDYDVYYCVEVVNRFEQFLLNTAAEAVDYVNRVGSPNCKVMLDTFHMNIEEDSMIGALRTAGSHLGHFHIGETNRRPPGQGRMPWDEIATGLVEIKYQGRLVMEPFLKMGGQVGQDIRVWRDLSNNADEQELDRQARDAVTFVRQKLASASAGSPVAQRVS